MKKYAVTDFVYVCLNLLSKLYFVDCLHSLPAMDATVIAGALADAGLRIGRGMRVICVFVPMQALSICGAESSKACQFIVAGLGTACPKCLIDLQGQNPQYGKKVLKALGFPKAFQIVVH